jgi:hypothetical protein
LLTVEGGVDKSLSIDPLIWRGSFGTTFCQASQLQRCLSVQPQAANMRLYSTVYLPKWCGSERLQNARTAIFIIIIIMPKCEPIISQKFAVGQECSPVMRVLLFSSICCYKEVLAHASSARGTEGYLQAIEDGNPRPECHGENAFRY